MYTALSDLFKNIKNPFSTLPTGPITAMPKIPTPAGVNKSVAPTMPGSTVQKSPLIPAPANGAPATPVAPPPAPKAFAPQAKPQVVAPTPPVAPVLPPVPAPTAQTTTDTKTTPPATPAVTPEAQKAVEGAEKAYQESLAISPEELSTQADLDRLIESAKTSYTNIKDQAIPLDFITGQLASVERRASDLAEPLERKLSRMQATRTAALEASKFALERADKKVEGEKSSAEKAAANAESARRFGVEQAGSEATRTLAEKKFEEDKRQYGLDYAIKQKELGIKQAESNAKTSPASATEQTQRQAEVLSLAKELRGAATGKGAAVGASFSKLVPFGRESGLQGGRVGFESKLETLKSNLTLDNLKLLKGAMSDKDLAFLNSIASSLNVNMSEDQFNKELDRIIGKIETASGGASTGAESYTLPNGTVVTRQADGTYK